MILVGLSSYSQYPTVKTIGKDTVVLMTLKQGEDINKRFVILNDSIKNINSNFDRYKLENGQRIQKISEDYSLELKNHSLTRAVSDSFRLMYMANKKIYLNSEVDHRRELKNLFFFTIMSFLITVYIAGSR